MKVLIENSGYALSNMGDVAMLQAAVQRMREILPKAELHVITQAPERLEKFCPGCHAARASSFGSWRSMKVLPVSYRRVGETNKERFRKLDAEIQFRFPRAAVNLMRLSARAAANDTSALEEFWNEVESSDAVVATGGGYFTDSFPIRADGILDTLSLAQKLKKPTAFFGQGLGPLTNSEIIKKLKTVGNRAELIGLREGRKGPEFLKSLGVTKPEVVVTGDDAIPLARKMKPPKLGNAIGFNVRVASYSGVADSGLESISAALRNISKELNTPVALIPIETKPQDSDVIALQHVVPRDIASNFAFAPNKPEELLSEISKCRLVITGSYHAGVFALSMGIPVIALIASEYYVDKFYGLQMQFGTGLEVVELARADAAVALAKLAKSMWCDAGKYSDGLQRAADAQIAEGGRVFQKFFGQFA